MKKVFGIILVVLTALCLFACSGDGGQTGNSIKPWDKLSGAGNGEVGQPSIITVPTSSLIAITSEMDVSSNVSGESINLSDLSYLPDGVTTSLGNLVISKAGAYELSGTLSGSVIVENFSGIAKIVLAGATIQTPQNSTRGAIVFNETSEKRYIVVKDGTQNFVSDSVGDTLANGHGGAIISNNGTLSICGGGTLTVTALGEDASGIKVKDDLTVVGTNLVIDAVKHGIKANDTALFSSATLKITSGNDGIKTDKEGQSQAEAVENASKPKAGYIYIDRTEMDIVSGDDGIVADSGVYIDNDDKTLKVKTNGGTPDAITENSSANAGGTAIKVAGISYMSSGLKVSVPANHDNGYTLTIKSGNFLLNANADALSSESNIFVLGGSITATAGDDGINANKLIKITSGTVVVEKCYEAIESKIIEITGGTVSVSAVDNGINSKEEDGYALVSGGNITVNAGGKAFDSDGWIKFDGGNTTIFGAETDTASLDSEKGVFVNAGSIIAFGAIGMVQNPSVNSTQYYINLNLPEKAEKGVEVKVLDEEENEILSVTAQNDFRSAVISASELKKDKSYTVTVGKIKYKATLTEIGTALGVSKTGGGNQGKVK